MGRSVGRQQKNQSLKGGSKLCGVSPPFNNFGGIKGCMGFVKDKDYYAPNTVLKEDIRNVTSSPQHRIVATFIKNISDDKYTELSYVAKKFDINELKTTKNIIDKTDQNFFLQ